MAFTLTNNSGYAAAVTAACAAYNATLPDTEEVPRASNPDFKATNDAYRDWVVDRWAQSCRDAYGVDPANAKAQEAWDRAQQSYVAQYPA